MLVMCGLLVAGCTASMDMQRRTIALSASAGGVSVENALQTKAGEDAVRAVPYEGHPSAGNPLEAALWLSYDCGKYSHAPQEPLPPAPPMSLN